MSKFLPKINFLPFIIIIFCLLLFLPGFFTYFHQDDFIHIYHSQTLSQLISAFNIVKMGEFPFYRPIPTQLYFYLGQIFFGLNSLPFHIVNFIIFAINILLVFKLLTLLTKEKKIASLALIFYAVNSTHFAPLYSPAYVHELFYAMFGLLTVIFFMNWINKKRVSNFVLSIVFFIMALMTKETAVVLPGILALVYFYFQKNKKLAEFIKIFISFVLILSVYLFAHFYYYGLAQGSSYQLIIGRKSFNILLWYFLWALSTPNILIDFVGPGLKINPVFFQVAQIHGFIYLLLFIILVLLGIVMVIQMFKDTYKKYTFSDVSLISWGIIWFVVGLVPLIVFPLHKLATEQAFSLVGLSLALSVLVYRGLKIHGWGKIISVLFLAIYILLAVNSVVLARQTHWIVRSADQARRVINHFKDTYPQIPDEQVIYFKNGEVKIPQYGSSRQLYQALGNGVGLSLVLKKPNLKLYFEDIEKPDKNIINRAAIIIDSSDFLGY